MVSIMTSLLQCSLFAPGPFYIYPWKPFINAFAGDSYAVGLQHFKAGHRHPLNLALHLAALFIQLGGNFALLRALDAGGALAPLTRALPVAAVTVSPLCALSAASWVLCLVLTPAPAPVTAVSAIIIAAAAFVAAPHITPRGLDLFAAGAMSLLTLVVNFAALRRPARMGVRPAAALSVIVGMPLWFVAWDALRANYTGALADRRGAVTAVLLGSLGLSSMARNPLKPVVIAGTLLLRAAGILCDSPALFFLGNAFMASLFQGVTHLLVREEATLLALERQGEGAKVRFEYAHVTFFPNLLLHTIWDALVGTQGKKMRRGEVQKK